MTTSLRSVQGSPFSMLVSVFVESVCAWASAVRLPTNLFFGWRGGGRVVVSSMSSILS